MRLTALASPRRREILRLVWDEERSAGEIRDAMPDVTFGAVSLQLKALERAGLVECRREKQFRYYRAVRESLAPVAAALVNRLELGLYKAEQRGPGRYWGNDGEGTEGLVELVYLDPRHRLYYLEGSHHSTLLPHVTGKAVVLLSMAPVKDSAGHEAVETTLVSYTRLDNRILAGLVSLLRPLVGRTVSRKLMKGVDAVTQLGLEMRRHPDRVLFEAADPPPLPPEDVAFLTQALAAMHEASVHHHDIKPENIFLAEIAGFPGGLPVCGAHKVISVHRHEELRFKKLNHEADVVFWRVAR